MVNKSPCLLCGGFEDHSVLYSYADERTRRCEAECPRCGTYEIDRNLVRGPFSASVGIRLSALARLATDREERLVVRTQAQGMELAETASVPTRASDYYERLLVEFSKMVTYPGEDPKPQALCRLAARSFIPTAAAIGVAHQLQLDHLISVSLAFDVSTNYAATLTSKGWTRVDELVARRDPSRRAFVAMWFDKSMNLASEAIQKMLVGAGYEGPFRVDDPAHEAPPDGAHIASIDDRILAGIRHSRFVIADFTGQRPSVYYEAGFAEGLGIHVFSCCREDHAGGLAFDRRNLEHILWKEPSELASRLLAKIDRRGWSWT